MVRTTTVVIATLVMIALAVLTLLAGTTAADNGVDGVIGPDEYPLSAELGDGHFTMYWEISNGSIKMGLQAETPGLVAIGIEPTRRMLDADMILAYRSGSEFQVHDAYSFGETGPHPDDTDEGGTFDLNEYTVVEVGGVTTFEFIRLLDTGDQLDNVIPETGKVKFIWATSTSDDFSVYHTRRGTAVIDIGTGEAESIEYPALWPYHAIFMSLAMTFLMAAMFCVVYKKNLKKKYLGYHHYLGTLGLVSATVGLIIGIFMVNQLESGHIRIVHSALALLDLGVAFIALSLGVVFMRNKELMRKVRKPHMYIGGLSILLMAVVVLMGIVYVFPV
jgi:hypothetical protein